MSVNPGFGGQSFIESQLRKIEAIRGRIDKLGLAVDLEVDGGVDQGNCRRIVEAGTSADRQLEVFEPHADNPEHAFRAVSDWVTSKTLQ